MGAPLLTGMVVRGDRGGLATMTGEAWRHLRPDVTVLVDLGSAGRGPCERAAFPDALVVDGPTLTSEALDLLGRCDVVWSAECWYGAKPDTFAVLHSMPELTTDRADRLAAPTTWRQPAGSWLVPVPAPSDMVCGPLPSDGGPLVVVFQDAPAMADRAGAHTLTAALHRCTGDLRLVVRNPQRAWPSRIGRVPVACVAETADWRQWPAGHVLAHPRRYGGLSLPAQEASAAGMGLLVGAHDPYAALPHAWPVASTVARRAVPMKGGRVDVHGVDPAGLAAALDTLAADRDLLEVTRRAALSWAEDASWPALLPAWRGLLTPP